MADAHDPVILVHGLWMSGLEFGVLRQRLQTRHGFDVHVFSYPSLILQYTLTGEAWYCWP